MVRREREVLLGKKEVEHWFEGTGFYMIGSPLRKSEIIT